MRSWGFLLSRRWVLFALTVAALVAGTIWLGSWQFDRLTDRKADNQVVRANETKDPAPVDDVLAVGRPVAETDEWRLVEATGTYAAEEAVVVRYRSREGVSGIDVVVPLVTADGPALLVDRGWLEARPDGTDRSDIPGPPSGVVTVTGWARADGTGDSTRVTDQSTRAISSREIGAALGREVYGGFVELRSEDGAPAEGLAPVELPELDNGPHFFYGLQWWFFGVLAVFGFCYLAWDERKNGPRGERQGRKRDSRTAQSARSIPPSTGSMAPVTNEAAGDSRKAAARPNSSGSP
ncbi:SURF1 family cytochrome oxidase biogenesis protein [Nocardioides dilutus]